jgi:hypothetical protein
MARCPQLFEGASPQPVRAAAEDKPAIGSARLPRPWSARQRDQQILRREHQGVVSQSGASSAQRSIDPAPFDIIRVNVERPSGEASAVFD